MKEPTPVVIYTGVGTRPVIERAVGYLMGAHGLDAVTAFNALRKRARDSRQRIADVAAEILEGAPPTAPGDQSQPGPQA